MLNGRRGHASSTAQLQGQALVTLATSSTWGCHAGFLPQIFGCGFDRGIMTDDDKLLDLTTTVVGSYVRSHQLPAAEVPRVIADVSSSLAGLSTVSKAAEAGKLVPAVRRNRSVHKDEIVCLEDGKRFKSLKRHLMVHHGLTPDQYREKWGLSRNYPMVTANYSARRSEIAKGQWVEEKRAPRPTKGTPATQKRKSGSVYRS